MRLTKISLEPQDRMLRLGFGKNGGRWFARVDFWWVGWRLS